jgi:hypothetical protein
MFGFWGKGFDPFFPVVFEQKRGKGGRAACLTEDSAYIVESRCSQCLAHRVQKEWQWLVSGVHSIMMVKSAQPGEGGAALSLSLCLPSRAKLWCQLLKEDTLPLFLLYPCVYSVVWLEHYRRCPMEINKGKLAPH